jgi:hypothetical protein
VASLVNLRRLLLFPSGSVRRFLVHQGRMTNSGLLPPLIP